jgi:hypothetical protein
MKGAIGRRPGLLLATAGVAALLTFSFSGPTDASSTPRTWTVYNTAALADEHADHDHDDARHPDKSEPTRGGLHRKGLLDTDLSKPGAAVNGLASTLSEVALSANRQIVQSDVQQVGPGESSDAEVTCPAPFKVVNGGESNDGNMVRLTKNYPVTTPTSSAWHVQVHNDESSPRTYRVYADCINGLTQYERVEHLNQDVAPGASNQETLKCAAGSTILGGGYSVEATDRFAVSASYAESGSARDWLLSWRNVGSSAARISTYAMCAAGVQQGQTTKGTTHDTSEYARTAITCNASTDQMLGSGWAEATGSAEAYLIVTDSYPTSDGYVVWGHQYNAVLSAIGYCGTVP